MDAINPKADAPRHKRGRPVGSKARTVFSRPGAKHDLVPLGDNSGPARFFRKMVRDIESDFGGRVELSRIEGELIRAFCGSATLLQVRNVEIALGETGEIDPTIYAALASTMLRIGSRLGLRRRPRTVMNMDNFLQLRAQAKRESAREESP
jgi:hypothetical protein